MSPKHSMIRCIEKIFRLEDNKMKSKVTRLIVSGLALAVIGGSLVACDQQKKSQNHLVSRHLPLKSFVLVRLGSASPLAIEIRES